MRSPELEAPRLNSVFGRRAPRRGAAAAVSRLLWLVLLLAGCAAEPETETRESEAPPDPEPVPANVEAGSIRVEVLNACGVAGLARQATRLLRQKGFDVVYFGNAAVSDRDSSVVLDRTGSPDLARAVARAIGITRIESRPDASLLLEVTVLLGRDWEPASNKGPPQK